MSSGATASHPIQLEEALRANEPLWEALHRLATLGLPESYLGAGCVAQTVWNLAHRKPPGADILDYDIVYFDPDLSEEAERAARTRVSALLADLPLELDVKNQARVHLWYHARFGYHIVPYHSVSDAIATWPTTATAVGVRMVDGALDVCAPFGVDDLFGLIVRPNRAQITPELYREKIERWSTRWPLLKVLPWESGVG